MVDIRGDQVVGDDLGEVVEPEQRNLVEHPSLVRDAGGQNVVEGRDAVGGDEKQLLITDGVNITHLATGVKLKIGKVSL